MTPDSADTDRTAAQLEMLANRVRKNRRKLKGWLEREGVTCYRLYDRDIPEIPMAIDLYDGRLHAARLAGSPHDRGPEWAGALASGLAENLGVDRGSVFLKERRSGKGGSVYAPMDKKGELVEVGEGGLRFLVNLTDYLDTGLFLDHRATRAMVREEARGKRFLNLFAYTGTFSVYAAAGGASTTTTVDLSNTYLDWARANMELNGFEGDSHRFVRDDVLGALEDRRVADEYDLAIVDPPTVSKSKAMGRDLDVQRDHSLLLNRVLERTSDGGVVYFSTNFTGFRFAEDRVRASRVEEISDRTVPVDFRNRKIHRCWRIEN